MASHRYHPDPDRGDLPRGSGVVLWDDCERCDEHAARPGMGLDDQHLWKLALLPTTATANDRKAKRVIEEAEHLARRLADIARGYAPRAH